MSLSRKLMDLWNVKMLHSDDFLLFEQDQIGRLQSRPPPALHQSQRLLPRGRPWVSLRSFCSRWRRPCRWESRPCRCQSSWTRPWSRPRPPSPCCLGPSPPVPLRTEEPPPAPSQHHQHWHDGLEDALVLPGTNVRYYTSILRGWIG